MQNRQILQYRNRSLDFLNEQVRSEKARFEVGEATRTDVAQAESSRAAAISRVSLAKANLASSEAVYVQIIGRLPGKLRAVKGVAHLVPRSMHRAMRLAELNHPAVKSTEHLVDQALFNVKSSESAYLPRVDLSKKRYKNFDQSSAASVSENFSVSATLSVPIYQGGRQSAQIRQNKEPDPAAH